MPSDAVTELLPCPFCGTSDLLGFEPSYEGEWTIVKCRRCGCSGSTGRSTSEQEAIAWWNRRAAPAVEPVAPDLKREVGPMLIEWLPAADSEGGHCD